MRQTFTLPFSTSAKEVMFSVPFVCLSAGLRKNGRPVCHETWWKGVAWAKEEPVQFWSGSESWGGWTNHFSLLLTLRDRSPVS